jgi:hypothetical protein
MVSGEVRKRGPRYQMKIIRSDPCRPDLGRRGDVGSRAASDLRTLCRRQALFGPRKKQSPPSTAPGVRWHLDDILLHFSTANTTIMYSAILPCSESPGVKSGPVPTAPDRSRIGLRLAPTSCYHSSVSQWHCPRLLSWLAQSTNRRSRVTGPDCWVSTHGTTVTFDMLDCDTTLSGQVHKLLEDATLLYQHDLRSIITILNIIIIIRLPLDKVVTCVEMRVEKLHMHNGGGI